VTAHAAPSFVLGSASAGRLGVLTRAGIDPEVVVSGVDETIDEDLDTATKVGALAERKAAAVASQRPDALVLGCDSMLDLDGEALGKPPTPGHVVRLWHRLAGRAGTLYTGHCLITPGDANRVRAVAATTVRFGTPSEAELAAYAASGEPVTTAGGFTIEGLAAPFMDGVDGDPGNVMGLSMPLLRRMLAEAGVSITDLWRGPAATAP